MLARRSGGETGEKRPPPPVPLSCRISWPLCPPHAQPWWTPEPPACLPSTPHLEIPVAVLVFHPFGLPGTL